MYNCKYCNKELQGNQRKFCNDNHKSYYYKKTNLNELRDLKTNLPSIFTTEWSELWYIEEIENSSKKSEILDLLQNLINSYGV